MAFRVLWAPDADDKLERLLANAKDAPAEAAAIRAINQRLTIMPHEFGESRYDAIRVGFVFPYGIQIEVMDDVQTVIVHDIWRIDRK
jgi:hypothetical protein